MRRNLIRYLPDILKRNLEFRILMEVQEGAGIQDVWDAAQAVFNNQFISTADEYGISRYEGILGLTPDEDDNLEDRRKAVLMAWYRKWNIGLPDLQKIAGIWFPDMTELEYQHPLMIVIWLTDSAPYGPIKNKPLRRELRELAPANADFDFAWRYYRIKELHRQVSVGEVENIPLQSFAGGSGLTDRTRGSGLLAFGPVLIVRERSKISINATGNRLVISSAGPEYETPVYVQIGDGLLEIDGSLSVAADSRVAIRDLGDTMYILSEED